MKKKSIYIALILLFTFKGYSQSKDSITLPKGGKEIKFDRFTNLYSLYITKNQEVYNDDKRLDYFQDISYGIVNQKNKIEPWMPFEVLIYADEKLQYKFIDRIKNHISPIPFIWSVHYMTDNISDLISLSFKLNGLIKVFNLEEILTLNEETEIDENSIEISADFLPGLPWWVGLDNVFYSGNKEDIVNALNKNSHNVLVVSKQKTLKYNEEILDNAILKELINQNKILFLKFDDDIYYADYIHAIQKIKKTQTALKESNQHIAYVIEISYKLNDLYKKLDIELK